MKKSHFWPYFIHKNLINLCCKSVYSSRKHPVYSKQPHQIGMCITNYICYTIREGSTVFILGGWYSRRNLVMPIFVFRENVVVIAISELRPGSNDRYENSTFYGPFRFLIFILVFNKYIILYISHFIEKIREMACLYLLH